MAVEAAVLLGGEVVSVDSCAVYRGFDIGSAKPGPEERRGVRHHLIDIRSPDEGYSAGDFVRDAEAAVASILARGAVPVLCGGTMMYVNALRGGLHDVPAVPEAVKRRVRAEVAEGGAPAAHARLMQADPVSARRLSPGDSQRIVRALEVYEATGRPLGAWVRGPRRPLSFAFDARYVVPPDRAALSLRLRERFEGMVERGLVEEVRGIVGRYGPGIDPLRSVGYRQVAEHVAGKASLDEAVEKGVAATRRLAKRQMAWIRKFSPGDGETVPA